jgi:hypothetical protein
MRKTANQAKISAQAEREKPALERCCQAAEAGFDRLTGLTKLFCGFMVPAISCSMICIINCRSSFLASMILQLSKEQKTGTVFNVHLHEFISF